MQFKIPQDVQRADRIVGPLTMRQLIIVAIGGGICYSLYLSLSKQYILQIWLPPLLFVGIITAAFAFFKFHDIPFEKFILYFIEYKFKPQKRTFQKMAGDVYVSVLHSGPAQKTPQAVKAKAELDIERLKKLSEMSARVDTHSKKLLEK